MRRKGGSLSSSLEHGLSAYAMAASAAGVGVLALGLPADAKIVYTPSHQKIPINKDFFLDLNHDGINDFRFHILTSDFNVRRETSGTRDSAFLWAYPQGTANQVCGKQPYAYALRAGVRIRSKEPFIKSRGTMGGVDVFSGAGPTYVGPWANSGKAVDHRYLGLQFIIEGQTHFGWARFNVRVHRNPESTVRAVLTGYAYETIPNKAIIAGKTHGGASLGALAAGSTALSRRRHKIRSK